MTVKILAAVISLAISTQPASALVVRQEAKTAFSIEQLKIGDHFFDVVWEVGSEDLFFGDRFAAQAAIDDALNLNDIAFIRTGNGTIINNYSVIDFTNFVTSTSFSTPGDWQDATLFGQSGVGAILTEVVSIPAPASILNLLTVASCLYIMASRRRLDRSRSRAAPGI